LLRAPIEVTDIEHGDRGTLSATVPRMRRLIREGAADPNVRSHAASIASSRPGLHPAKALFEHIRDRQPYVYDEALVKEWGLPDDTTEVLQGASYQVANEQRYGSSAVRGDCDDRCILFQSMAEALGYPTRLVLVRGPGRSDYSHVYSEVDLGAGGLAGAEQWVSADTIMNGREGRPLLSFGEEVGPPKARGRVTVPTTDPVGPGCVFGMATFLVGLWLLWRAK
jgi:hypothetical protein